MNFALSSTEFPCLKSQGTEFHSVGCGTRSPLATGPDFRGKKHKKREENVWFWLDVYFEHVKTKLKESKAAAWDFHCRQTQSGIKEKSNIKNTIFGVHTKKGSARKSLLHLFTCFSAVTTASLGTRREQILLWFHSDSWWSCHYASSWSCALATWPLDILAQDFKLGSLGFETRRAPVHLATISSSSCRYGHRMLGLCSFLLPSLVLFLF